jgi:hypothetical protein
MKGRPADGIGLQIGSRNVVRHCVVEDCRGPGFHAGGRETDSEFSDNVARGNLGDGFYFCAWVTRVAVKNNKFTGNKENGIGGLGDSSDTGKMVEGNLCRENDGNGISLWPASGTPCRTTPAPTTRGLRPVATAAFRSPRPTTASCRATAVSTTRRSGRRNTASRN